MLTGSDVALISEDEQVGGLQAAQDAPDPGGFEVVHRAGQ
jgi:hypothetical protein